MTIRKLDQDRILNSFFNINIQDIEIQKNNCKWYLEKIGNQEDLENLIKEDKNKKD